MDDDSSAHGPLIPAPAQEAGDAPALLLNDISKSFGKVAALSHVSFAAKPGRITGLLGENGAGKTTLMRIAFGLLQPDAGEIKVAGIRRTFRFPADSITAGIGMVHQQFSLVPSMTVAENVALGARGSYSPRRIMNQLDEIAQKTGLYLDPSRRVADLSNAERQKLEIVRTFANNARILILDEPTSVLTPKDQADLFRELTRFARAGNAAVLITHKLRDALKYSDDIAVLRHGRLVLAAPTASLDEASLAAAMLGTAASTGSMASPTDDKSHDALARLSQVVLANAGTTAPQVAIDFAAGAGEVTGVAALEGGAAEFLRVLARRTRPISGDVYLPEFVAFVPENRRDDALVDGFTLAENLALAGVGSKTGLINWETLEFDASALLAKYSVKAPSARTRAYELSGGNQQRFVVGRELRGNPSLIVLENPTQGLDINAAAFVHEQARKARKRGAAIVFYSSDLDELTAVSDRVIVVTASGLEEVDPDRDKIGLALLGAGSRK